MKTLPPLPGSDPKTLSENHFNTYYRLTPRKLWGDAEMSHVKQSDLEKKCEHSFIQKGPHIHCERCHWELFSPIGFSVEGGKLYYRSKRVL